MLWLGKYLQFLERRDNRSVKFWKAVQIRLCCWTWGELSNPMAFLHHTGRRSMFVLYLNVLSLGCLWTGILALYSLDIPSIKLSLYSSLMRAGTWGSGTFFHCLVQVSLKSHLLTAQDSANQLHGSAHAHGGAGQRCERCGLCMPQCRGRGRRCYGRTVLAGRGVCSLLGIPLFCCKQQWQLKITLGLSLILKTTSWFQNRR